MAEYIEREAVLKKLTPYTKDWYDVQLIPIADVAEVKHGAWVVTRYHLYLNVYEEFLCCSVCGYEHQHDEWFEYCPNCGAKMDGKGADNE